MKRFFSLFLCLTFLALTAAVALAVDAAAPGAAAAPPSALSTVFAWLKLNWFVPVLFIVEQVLPRTNLVKANSSTELVVNLIRGAANRAAGGTAALLLAVCLFAAGCTTLNVSMNTTAGDNNKPAVKTDAQADQNISPTTSATIPLK